MSERKQILVQVEERDCEKLWQGVRIMELWGAYVPSDFPLTFMKLADHHFPHITPPHWRRRIQEATVSGV